MPELTLTRAKLAALPDYRKRLRLFEVYVDLFGEDGAEDKNIEVSVKAYSFAHAAMLVMQQAELATAFCATLFALSETTHQSMGIVTFWDCACSANRLAVDSVSDGRVPLA